MPKIVFMLFAGEAVYKTENRKQQDWTADDEVV